MNKPESLNGIISDLVRCGLPLDYAERAAAELADHHRDLVDQLRCTGLSESQATTEASRRLGDSRTLVNKTVREYQRRYWCARWRVTTFVLAPIPLLLLLWIATVLVYGLCLILPLKMLGVLGSETPPDGIISTSESLIGGAIQVWFLFAMPALTIFLLARLARRSALAGRWLAISAVILALSALVFTCGYPNADLNHRYLDGRPLPADQFVFTVGLPVPNRVFAIWRLDRIGRMLMPLAFAGIVLWRIQQASVRSAQLLLDGC